MRRNRSLVFGTLAAGVLLAAASPVASAQSEGDFGLTDTDKNGRIDRKEYQKRMIEVFYFADRNKNGVVTVEELAAIEEVDTKAFAAADTNHDGKLTESEFVAYRMIDFDAADKNGDGVLTVDEVEAWTASRQ